MMATSVAHADPIEFVEQRDTFMLFDDPSGSVEQGNFFSREPFFAVYDDIEAGFLAVHPDDSQFLIVYTTWTLPAGVGALYQAVANDVQGIGYEHIAELDPIIPEPYFDDTPGSQFQGFMHMNRWTQYLGNDEGGLDDEVISLIFGQEFGHAWLAFPHVALEGANPRVMLGRSDAHWSFYLHTAGSPVQGHDWVDNGDGTFTAQKTDFFEFSDLDLYLMGLIPPEDVEPFFAIESPSDCVDSASQDGGCAPPDAFQFQADSYTVTGTRRDLTVQDIIASEGARVPAWPDAPSEYDVSFILIKRPDETLSEEELEAMDAIVRRSIEIFDAQTRGLASIVNRTAAGDPGGGTSGGMGTGDDGGSDTTDPGPGDGSTTDAPGAGTTTGGSSTGSAEGPEAGGATESSGCGCTADGPQRGDFGLLLVFLGLLVPFRTRRSR